MSRFVSWLQVLPLLGVELHGALLPCITTCPLCQGSRLYVYRDFAMGGEWFHCRGCRARGDMIELAATVWKLDLCATVLKLQARGVVIPADRCLPEYVQRYEEQIPALRARMREFWRRARRNLVGGGSAAQRTIQRNLGLPSSMWSVSASRFVGSCTTTDLEEVFLPGVLKLRRQSPGATYDANAGNGRLFRGGGWRDLLVVAACDLPGRLSGFLVAGRNGNPAAGDVFFKRARFSDDTTPQGASEPGLVLYESLWAPRNSYLGESGFVFADAMLATQLQLRWLRENPDPLPLAGFEYTADRRLQRIWSQLPRRDYVMWLPQFDAVTLSQARAANARVVTPSQLPGDLRTNMDRRSPLDWLRDMQRAAVPWQTALAQEIGRLSQSAAEELLLGMRLDQEELRTFGQNCPAAVRQRVSDITSQHVFARKTVLKNRTVNETTNGWVVEKTGVVISRAIIRITHVISVPDREPYYSGYVQYKGEQLPFTEVAAKLDRGLLAWARQFLAGQGKGILDYAREWNSHAVTLAIRFHEPQCVEATDCVGWLSKQASFQFPQFVLQASGDTHRQLLNLTTPETPCREVSLARGLTAEELAALAGSDDAAKLFWGIAASVLSHALANMDGSPQFGLALVGEGSRAAPRIATALGCLVLSACGQPQSINYRIHNASRHNWPICLLRANVALSAVVRTWFHERHSFIATLDQATAAVLHSNRNYHRLLCPRPIVLSTELLTAGPVLVGQYLQDLANRHWAIDDRPGDHLSCVLHDMAAWFERAGGRGRGVRDALQLLQPCEQQPGWIPFAELLCQLYEDGEIHTGRVGFRGKYRKPHMLFDPGDSTLWIPQAAVARLINGMSLVPLGVPQVTQHLQAAGLLKAETMHGEARGWVVPESWWNEQLQKYQTGLGCPLQIFNGDVGPA